MTPVAPPPGPRYPLVRRAPLTGADIQEELEKLQVVKASVDAAWAAGKRDGPRMSVWALANAAQEMYQAILDNDANAFKLAAHRASDRVFSAKIHGNNWVKTGSI